MYYSKISNNKVNGNKGEELACRFLKKQGYQILARNFLIRGGEIDIVARDGDELVFVEVKARYSHQYGLPEESITPWKLKSLQKSALFYIQKINWGTKPYRFDLVTVDYTDSPSQPEIKILPNITY